MTDLISWASILAGSKPYDFSMTLLALASTWLRLLQMVFFICANGQRNSEGWIYTYIPQILTPSLGSVTPPVSLQ